MFNYDFTKKRQLMLNPKIFECGKNDNVNDKLEKGNKKLSQY